MTDFALWYEKYRPQTLDDYVWVAADFKSRITFWIEDAAKLPHLILHGPPGTGKTTLAEIIGRSVVEDTEYDLLYINTNKHSGVDSIREGVTQFCETGGFGGLKVVIIDEADGLSIAAQDKLRGVINDFGSFVRFIFTANKIRSLSDALKSRCRVYEVKALDEDQFLQRLIDIAEAEGINVAEDYNTTVVGDIYSATYPDLRRAIDLLQDCHGSDGLVPPASTAGSEPEWSEGVVGILLNRGTPQAVRELVTALRKEELGDVYRFIYEHSGDLFEDSKAERAALVTVADFLKVHGTVAFPDINLAGCLNRLVQMKQLED